MTDTTKQIVEAINEQLDRLEANDATGETGGLICTAPVEFPDGWVLIEDEAETWRGPGWDALAALEGCEITEDDVMEISPGFAAAWRVLGELDQYLGDIPGESGVNEALQETLVWTGFAVEGDNTEVYAIVTNSGIRFGFAPHDTEFASASSEIGYSDLYLTAKEAFDEAESFVSMEADREAAQD